MEPTDREAGASPNGGEERERERER